MARLTIVTSEREPLGIFGTQASSAVRRLLAEAGITLHAATDVRDVRDGAVIVPGGGVVQRAQRVVALPRLTGSVIRGLPIDGRGFVPVDDHGRVHGAPGIWAVGDVTDFPLKQGGIAAQQADAAARSIAAQAGAPVAAEPFRPTLRAKLHAGDQVVYLSETVAPAAGADGSAASGHALWWPPTKVVAPHLSSYLDELQRRQVSAVPR